MVVFLHVQNFTNKILSNLVLHSFFLQLRHCDKVVTKWKCTPIIINLFIIISISWYNDILGCKPTLIEKFCHKMFSKHPPWYIKVPYILKIVKLWQFFVNTITYIHSSNKSVIKYCKVKLNWHPIKLMNVQKFECKLLIKEKMTSSSWAWAPTMESCSKSELILWICFVTLSPSSN
jgi:hypothetical protein